MVGIATIFHLIAGIQSECKTRIEVGLSLSYQAENPGKNRRKFVGNSAILMIRTSTVTY
jgi:hypothetical protein